MRSFIFALFAKHKQNDQVKKDEMGTACSMYAKKTNAFRVLVGKIEV